MDAVTYPNDKVINFINDNLIPMRVLISSKPLPQRYNAQWTPTFLILDADGQEHHRTVGFLPPEELIPSLLLGIAKSYFDREYYTKAEAIMDRVLSEFPNSAVAPEAIYYRGVSEYKETHDATALKHINETLQTRYKDSEWARRASVYRLL